VVNGDKAYTQNLYINKIDNAYRIMIWGVYLNNADNVGIRTGTVIVYYI
jgi:hypothetical protein